MAIINRVRAVWSGSAVVGGGISTFYFEGGDTGFVSDVHGFFTGIKTVLPPSVTITVDNSGDVFESTTGALSGSWSEVASPPIVGSSGTSEHAAGVGARIVWRTNGIVGNRRSIGSTFIVPLHVLSYQADGTLQPATITALQLGITNLLGSTTSSPQVWHRPVGGSGGLASDIISGSVPDKVSWLRSRRT